MSATSVVANRVLAQSVGLSQSGELICVSGCYGGISWKTWFRLRDYYDTGIGLAEEHSRYVQREGKWEGERVYCIKLTEKGREFYKANYEKYRELYPTVEAPEP